MLDFPPTFEAWIEEYVHLSRGRAPLQDWEARTYFDQGFTPAEALWIETDDDVPPPGAPRHG